MSKDGDLLVKKSQAIIADSKATIVRSKNACKRSQRLTAAQQLRRAKIQIDPFDGHFCVVVVGYRKRDVAE
jgi:hypothetical protein